MPLAVGLRADNRVICTSSQLRRSLSSGLPLARCADYRSAPLGGGTSRSFRVAASVNMARPAVESLIVLSVMAVLWIAGPGHRAAATGQHPVGRSLSGACRAPMTQAAS